MRKILFFTAGLLLALSLGSCDKGDDYSPSAKRLLPSEIIGFLGNANPSNPLSSETIWKLKYDSENRITELSNSLIYNGEPYGETTVSFFSYDGDNITVSKNGVTRYYVRKGSVIEVTNTAIPGTETIEIDDMLKSKNYVYDSNGNTKYYNGTLRYDRENGVFRHVNMPAWYLTNVLEIELAKKSLYNNCVECLTDQESGHGFEINYNTDDYPVEIHRFPINLIGSGAESYEIEYIEAN